LVLAFKLSTSLALLLFFIFYLCFSPSVAKGESVTNGEYVFGSINPRPNCNFEIQNSTGIEYCYTKVETRKVDTETGDPGEFVNKSTVKTTPHKTIHFDSTHGYKISKTKIKSDSIPRDKYHNIAEPSFASNGKIVFYTANHFAARSTDTKNWQYVNPSFDFRALNGVDIFGQSIGTIDLFWADQRALYDTKHKIFIWVRQGIESFEGGSHHTNIDRLAISKDALKWTVYDFRPDDIFWQLGITNAVFDYPQIVINDKYLYFTSSIGVFAASETYGSIIRFSLRELADNTNASFVAKLDREVSSITPVDGSKNPVYLGTHLRNDTSKMKIYSWNDNSNSTKEKIVRISAWNDIHNRKYCTATSDLWWCEAHTSSKIRSSWLYKNTINFLWNAIVTYDGGRKWLPYVDSATFRFDKNMAYERKYHLADRSKAWVFGAATPDSKNRLGMIAFYETNSTHPEFNLAFGKFNHASHKWDVVKLASSTSHMPVLDNNNRTDYTWGDFITIRKHVGPSKDNYSWDAAGYTLSGKMYYNVNPYYIKIK
jgi:hypothetical protein